jgi:transcription antitermination factor NusG
MNFENHVESWFAVRVKSRCEKSVAMMVEGKDIETFLPLYQSRQSWSDREKLVEFPLFAGYVFCRLNPAHRLKVLIVPGVVHFVGIGKAPIPIEETEIAALQAAVKSGLPAEPCPYLEIGQRVVLEDGPLSGVEGIYTGSSKNERIIVSITLLKRSVSIAIERHWARPVNETGGRLQTGHNAAAIDLKFGTVC